MKFKSLMFTAFSLTILAIPAYAQTTVVTQSTADGGTTTTKTTTTRYYYDTQDVNSNGIIDSQEFAPYVYSRWDMNRDGYVSNDEWTTVSRRWYNAPAQVEYSQYSYWDKNKDGRITADEVETAVGPTKLYGMWDKNGDNIIESDEYEAATFSTYDLNNDGNISLQEWRATNTN